MCETCTAVQKHGLGGDSEIAVCALPNGAAMVAARTHAPFGKLAPTIQSRLLTMANAVSVTLYEAMGAHGTTIIGEDGEHAHYLIIKRVENDGLPLSWEGKKASPSELQETGKRIADEAWTIGKREMNETSKPVITAPKPARIQPETPPEPTEQEKEDDLEDDSMRTPGSHIGRDLGDVAKEIQTNVKRGPTEEKDYRIRNLTRRR